MNDAHREGVPSPREGGTWVIDLDGVIWLAGEPIPGGKEAVEHLREADARVLFASNNSSPTIGALLQRLARAGIDASPDEVVTSAQAAASMLEPGSTILSVADDGVAEAMAARGVTLVEDRQPDAVVVGWTQRFDFDLLERAMKAVRGGGRLIGTNEDATLPAPEGVRPGAGSILAAVATASGATPEVAGKPHEPLARLVAERAGRVAVVVGDRPSTDGALARRLGVPFALVLSGVTGRGAPADGVSPDLVADNLAAVVEAARR